MNLAPEDIEEVKARAAGEIADRVIEELLRELGGTMGAATLLPIQVAAALLGVSVTQAKRLVPTVDLGMRPLRVRFDDLTAAISDRRTRP